MNYKKEDYLHMGRLRQRALILVAQDLGEEHPITKMMGSASYGRHAFETGPQPNLQSAIYFKAGLDGMFEVLHRAAHIADDDQAIKSLQKHFPRNFTAAP